MESKNPFSALLQNTQYFFANFFSSFLVVALNVIRPSSSRNKVAKRYTGISLLFIVMSLSNAFGQVDGDYRTTGTGDWNDNTIWEVYGGGTWNPALASDYPGAAAGAGTVYITGSYTVSVTANIPNSIGAIDFNGAAESNIVQFSGAYSLDITGAVTINPPTSNGNDNGLYVNSGSVTCTSLTSTNSGNNARDCKVAISVGTLTVNGDIVMGNNASRNDITFSDAGVLAVTGNLTTGSLICVDNSTVNIGGSLSPSAFTVANSTVNFNGADQDIPAYVYYNLIASNSGTKTLPNTNLTINGALTINDCVLAFTSSSARTLSVGEDLSGNGTIDMSSGDLTHNLNLAGTANSIGTLVTSTALSRVNYTFAGDQIIFSSPNYRYLRILNGGNKTLEGDVTVADNLVLSGGKIVLGSYDLTLTGTPAVSSVASDRYVVADGTGQLKKVFATGATSAYILPVGDAINYSPVRITFDANSVQRTIGVNLTDTQHPNDGTSDDYISRYWSFTDDQAGTYTYDLRLTFIDPDDLTGTYSNIKVNRWDGSIWTQYNTTGASPYFDITNETETTAPLNNSEFTGRVNPPETYTWNQTGVTADWTVPSNWTPDRLSPQPNDILIFDNNGTTTATNVPTQTIENLTVSNNSDVTLEAAAGITLTINDATGTDLDINSGSALTLSTNVNLTLGASATASVDGTLTVGSLRTFTTNAISTVTTVSGTLVNSGTVTTSATGLVFNAGSIYDHSRDGGTVPTATWDVTSNCNITGLTAAAPGGLTQTFGNFNYSSVYGLSLGANLTVDGDMDISVGSINGQSRTIDLAGDLTGNGDLLFTGGRLNIGGDYLNTGTFTYGTSSTVEYFGTTQQVKGTSYYNLIISGGGVKTISLAVDVNGSLTLTSGVLQLGDYNLTITNALAIGGSPFSINNMVETDGTGRLIRTASVSNQSFNLTYPVGSGGYYNPFIITGLPNIAPAARSISVGAVPVNPNILTNGIDKYWDIAAINLTTDASTLLSFAYNAGEVTGDPLLFQPYTDGSGTWSLATGPSAPGSNPATSTGSATITGSWTVGSPSTFYSYQTGFWDQASTWTFDPGGTTGPGTFVPGQNDKVVILSGRTVSLQSDDFTQNLDITINDGGILDLSTHGFFSTLTALRGGGTLKLASSLFPSATVNTFVTTDGGTTEYNNIGSMSATQATYYNLTINSAGSVVLVNDVTLNGDLNVQQGIFQINDATPRRLHLVVNGDVAIDNSGQIAIGTGGTRSNAGPLPSITGSTGSFINYYELNSHRIQIYGDFTNNGIAKFSNLTYPIYNQFPANGFATVYFQGSSDKALTCNGQTDFYNLVVDKGTDQTFKLTVNSSAYNNFRLFGANTSDASVTLPSTPAGDPNIKKSLWIKNGTLVLQGLVVIPSLSEGSTSGTYPSDYIIPSNGALLIDGVGVIVLSTADDYTEVNAAYGLSGGSNAAYGINASGGYSGLSVLGKLQVDNGYLSTRESSGLLYWSYAPGQFILNGGKVDAKQFHNPEGTSVGLISYSQTGGDLIIRGRFKNTVSYSLPADLANPSMNTARTANGIDPTSGIGAFSINSNASNAYSMSGGTISVYDVCNTSATPIAFLVNCPVSNINVTGGTVSIIPTTGTVLADADYMINSSAEVYDLLINRVSGSSDVQLNINPLVVLNDLTISAGDFLTNNLDVTVGGDFSIASGTSYDAGTNTTTFNGSGDQIFTVDIASPLDLNKLTIDKTAGINFNFAGSQSVINVASDFSLVLGTLNDNGNTINIAGNVYNSGVHAGTGIIVLNGTSLQSIGGNGIFNHLELNNTNAASAPVSLTAACTISGSLTLSQDKLFDISTYNLKLNAGVPVNNYGPLRYIKSAGNSGDGGLTRTYSSPVPFVFPIGVVNYTPATIGLSSAPTAYGSITVIPVNFAHPNVTTSGRSLSYFWRTKSSGFTLGSATVTHGYTYDQSNVVTGADITEDEYVAARFDITSSTWTNGTASDVDEAANIIGEPGSGSFLENVSFIDGDYTAGDDNPTTPFGVPLIYYSRINGAGAGFGLWSDVNTWSTDPVLQHTGAAAATVPGVSDIVIIGGLDSVYLATDVTYPYTTPDVDPRSCASLKIEAGSALDIGYNPSSSFGIVLNHSSGNGNFRLTTSAASGSTYIFPGGDFSDFNVNLGTTELYTTNPAAGTTYWLPNGVTSYGNLILSPLGGSNIIFPNNDLTIYGNLITRGQNADSWFCPTWNSNYPTAPTTRIAKTITVEGNLDIQGGSLIWFGNGSIAQDIVVEGDVIVGELSALDVWSGATVQSISIGGSLINNADGLSHGLSTTSKADFTLLPLTFFGSTSASITSTIGTPLTIFQTVTVNKGTSQATTLTCDIAGTLTTPTNNWLTLQNGTFRYMRTDPATDFTISTTTPFSIPSTAGLYIDMPSNANNINILIGDANNDNGDLLLSGKLTVINGDVYVGRTNGTTNANNDIEYTTSGASAIDIQGGTLTVNSQIRRDPLNAGGILKYSQSGGAVVINGRDQNGTNAKLEVLNTGSNFTMSGGTLTILRGNGSLTTPSSPFGDLYLRPQSGSVTGGTIIFQQGVPASTENYYLDATIPLYNLTITGTAGQPATVWLLTSPLVVNGDMTIDVNRVLNTNNNNVTFNGNLINTPGVGGYVAGTNLTTFSASNGGPYAGAQTITGATDFYDLIVNSGTSLTLSDPSTVNGDLTLSTGNMICGGNAVTVIGDVINNATYTDDNSVGSGLILAGTTLQHISGTGAFSRLTLNNALGAQIDNDITLQEDLTMTQGVLNIKNYLFTLGVNSLIQGAPFSATKMITSDGVFSNVGLRKFFNPGATTFLFPIGTSSKYTPGLLTVTASNTVGYVRINNINSRHPAVIDPANALDYYWEIESSGITGFSGNMVLNYLEGDVVGDESNYLAARLITPGTTWSQTLGVDPSLNTVTFNYITSNNLSGEYTAGITSAFPGNVPEFTSNADGNWTDPSIWTQTGGDPYTLTAGGPNGFIVNVNHEVTINANYSSAYRITINDKLKIPAAYYGHNLGTVDGSGTLYLESGSFPAGVFNSFLSCANNSTVEYGGTGTYTIVADLYSNIPNIIFSGTGTRVLPNKDLTVCSSLIIDGPTLDNSIYNKKLTIQGSMERYNTGAFKSGTGSGATVSFEGTGIQTIGGSYGDFSGTNALNNFEINNSAGLLIDNNGEIEVKGNLLLTDGLINSGANRKLTITNSAINCVIPSGGSSTSFVNGPLIKKISQYDYFLFPVGIYTGGTNVLGNKLKLSSTQTGPLLWSVEYKSPNSTSGSVTSPLLGVSSQEYYTVEATAGSQAILNINWTPSSDITPLVTGGLSNIRLAKYNAGLSSWEEISTSASGDNSNGTATSTVLLTSTGSNDYTLGSITDLRARAKLDPTGPVCGAAGIPVTFTAPFPIPFDYTLGYTLDGIAQLPVTISSVPYILPTPSPGLYKLTDFTYNSGATTGVVDTTSVTTYAEPTVSDAGTDQTLCGVTTTNLAGNTPVIGTGQWSIISGSGGTVITPSSPTSQFIGLNNTAYTLRWTITNGTCISEDDVNINFTIQPNPPAAASPQTFCGPSTIADLVAVPPVGSTVDWYNAASGGVLLPGSTALVDGTTYYAESNGGGGCLSLTRTAVTVTITTAPTPAISGNNVVCPFETGVVYSTPDVPPHTYSWVVIGGTIVGSSTGNSIVVDWGGAGVGTVRVTETASPTCFTTTPDFNVTKSDAVAPVILCPGNLTATCDISEQPPYADLTAFTSAGGSVSDNCGVDNSSFILLNEVSNGLSCPETVTRTYRIADINGNTSTCTQDIVINDTQNPVIVGTLTDATVEGCSVADAPAAETTVAGLEALAGGIAISDNCTADGSLVVTSSDASAGTCPVVVTRTYTVTDACGNSVNIVHMINVDDTQAPVVVGTLTTTTVEGCSATDAPAAETTVAGLEALAGGITITDACTVDGSLVVTSSDASAGTCPVVVTRTYTVTDACGNSVNIVHTINVDDTQAPVVVGTITTTTVEGCSATDAPAAETTVAGLEALAGGITITDACTVDGSLVVTSSDASAGTCPVVVTRTYTVTDACGNSVNIVHTINVDDTQAPVVVGTITTTTVEGCSATDAPAAETTVAGLEALAGGITITDACTVDGSLVVTSSDASAGTCPVVVTRTYTVTDACGNSVNIVHTINVDDTQAPVVVGTLTTTTVEGCSATDAPAAETTVAGLEALAGGITITDACTVDGSLVVTSSDASAGTCPVVVTRTYTVTDACGNSVNIVHTINVDDTQAPVVVGTLTTTTVEGCSATDAPVAETTVAGLEALAGGITITDACTVDGSLVVTSSDASAGTCPVVVTRTYTVTDACGNSVNIVHTINVDDTQAPVVVGTLTTTTVEGCSATDAPAAETTVAGLEALAGGITITDACTVDGSLVVTSSDASAGTCPVVVTRTYTVTDACGNSVNIVHMINVDDTQAPVVVGTITTTTVEGCSATDAPAAETTVAGLEALAGGITITDACTVDASLVVTSSDASAGTCPVVVTRTYTVTDACGNSVNIVHTINVDDTQAPVVVGTLTTTTVEGCSATDAPAAETTVAGLEALAGGITITDACTVDGSLVVTSSDASAGTCPVVVTRTYTVTDACGNSVNIVHTINVDDTQAPVVVGTITTTTVEGCSATDAPAAETTVAGLEALAGGITITDACTVDGSLVVTSSDASAGTCPVVVTRTYTVTDACGNSVNIVHTINVDDTQAPVVVGTLTTTTVEGCSATDAPAAETTVAGLEALAGGITITDACTVDGSLVVTSSDASAGTCPVVVTRTYTVTDACGNSVNIVHTINVDDTQAPVVVGTITTATVEGCSAADAPAAETTVAGLEALAGGITITDACTVDGSLVVTSSDASAGTCPVVVTRTYTVTDECGNSVNIVHTINVDDTQAPVVVGTLTTTTVEGCSATDAPAAETTVAGLEALAGGITITDACTVDGSLVVTSSDASAGTCPVVVTRTYTVTDACGNSVNIVHTINVDDTQAPVVVGTITTTTVEGCSATDAPAVETTVAGLEALAGGITITDACTVDGSLVVTSSDASAGTCPVVVTRTYTVTDECGNSVNIVHTINVDDTQAPVVVGTITTTTVEGCSAADAPAAETTVAGLEALAGGITITDACTVDGSLVVTSSDASAGTCPVVVTRTYTVTDACGNSVNIVHTINVDDTQTPVVVGTLTTTTVEGCTAADAPAAETTVAGLEALAGGITITDACTVDGSLVVTSSDASAGTCPVVVTRTYTVTDECGNSVNIVHTINVDDTQAPVVVGTLTTTTVEGCSATDAPAAETTVAGLEALAGGITITDACTVDGSLGVTSSDASAGTCPVVVTRTYTVTDECGNSVNIVHTINVDDTQAPVVVGTLTTTTVEGCTAADAPAVETTVAGLEALAGGITITDACTVDGSLVVTSSDASAGTCPVVVTRTYTVTDACGNSVNIVHTINVDDTQAPVVVGTLTTTTVEGCSAADAPAAETTVAGLEALAGGITITDACTVDGSLVVTSSDASAGTCPVVVTRTYTVTDECGNSVNIVHTINVDDTQAPVVVGTITTTTVEGCSATDAPAAETTVAGLEALAGGITITDACTVDGSLVVTSSDASAGTCPVVVTRTYTVTDECGNSVNIVHTINVDDTQAPVVVGTITTTTVEGCSAADAPAAETTVAGLEALAGGITITDACTVDGSLVVTSSDASAGTCPVVVTRTYTVTDACGNSVNIVHTINVDDTQAPVVVGTLTTTTVEGCSATDAPAAETTVAGLEALAGGITITDACTVDGSLVVTSSDASAGTCPVVVTRTYTVTDECGNSVNIVHTINVDDTQAPVVVGTITTATVEGCSAADAPAAETTVAGLEALAGGITITDACTVDGSLVVTSSDASAGTCPVVVTRTYTVTDECGNSVNIVHTINVDDTQAPVVVGTITTATVEGCSAADAPAAETTVAGLEALAGGITITDACTVDGSLVVTSSDASAGTCPVVVTRTYTVTDACGNSVNIVHTINVDDTQAPVVVGTLTTTTVEGCSATDAPAAETTVAGLEALAGGITITDACTVDASLVVTSSDASAGTCPVVVTRTYTVTDACGNSVNIVHTINVDDTQAPVVVGTLTTTTVEGCSATDAPAAETTVAGLEALAGGITITDACTVDASLVVTSSDASAGTCPVVVTRTYTVTDACGNSVNIVHTINVDDTQAPVVVGTLTTTTVEGCSATDAPAAETTVAGLEALAGGITITDACTVDGSLVVTSSDASAGTCPVVVTRTYTVTDECGNSVNIVHTINVDDTQAPVVVGTLTTTTVEGCSATDAPAAETTVAGLEALAGGITITDACTVDGSLVVTSSDASAGTCPVVVTRTYTVTDECGNSVNIVHTINVDDTQAPVVVGTLTTTTVEGCSATDAPAAETTVAGLEALAGGITITDACTVDGSLVVTSSDASAGTCPVVVTRTYTVTDACGNSVNIVHTINVDDTQAPVVVGTLTDATVEGCSAADAPAAETTVAGLEALAGGITITDACTVDASLVVTSSDASAGTCPVVVTRTYTVTDACGNSVNIVHTINVDDTQAPVVVGTLTDATVEGCTAADAPAAETTVAGLEALAGGITVTDCSADTALIVTNSDVSSGTCPVVITRTYTVADSCGNSVDIIHTINISDTQAPAVVGALSDTLVEGCSIADIPVAVTTIAGLEALAGGITITDVCTPDTALIVSSDDVISGTCPIVVTRTYSISDSCGNSVDIIHNITVADTLAPVVTGTLSDTNIDGCSSADAPVAETTIAGLKSLAGGIIITDNCTPDTALILTSSDALSGTCPVVITRTYNVADSCGNSVDIVHTITVADIILPIISDCPVDISVSNDNGTCGAIVTWVDPTAMDNCNLASLVSSHNSGDTFPAGTTVVTYTATDDCGNVSICSFNVNVTDSELPTISCPSDISQDTDDGFSYATVTVPDAVISDNCMVASLTWSMTGVTTDTSSPTGINQIGTYVFNPGITTVTYIVSDSSGNSATCNFTVTVTQPFPLAGIIVEQNNISCYGDSTGSVTVEASGGVIPYEYKLDTGSYQSSGTFTLLPAGSYIVRIKDAVSDSVDVSVTITQPASALTGVIDSQTNVLCFGGNAGSVTIAAAGGTPPYLYKMGSGSYQTSGTFGSLIADNYTITIQDANLCTFDVVVNISQPVAALSGNILTQTNVSCLGYDDGSVSVGGNGGTSPYQYSLNGGTSQSSGIFNDLESGTYTVTISDANLCTVDVMVTITEPDELTISSEVTNATCPDVPDGAITLTIEGGTATYNVLWSDGITTVNRQDIADDTYSVVVTDQNGCAASADIEVGVEGSGDCIEIQEVITPNNDGYNDVWIIKNIDLFPNAEVSVFTRWGKMVYHSKNILADPWDGTFKGKLMPTDSYHYILHLNDGSEPKSGAVSIIR